MQSDNKGKRSSGPFENILIQVPFLSTCSSPSICLDGDHFYKVESSQSEASVTIIFSGHSQSSVEIDNLLSGLLPPYAADFLEFHMYSS